MRGILTFVLAGGRGERLDPLTRDRTKPAVPFGGIFRIIDFTMSNCVNSGLRRIYILTQYKSFSLQKHLLAGWDIVSTQLGEFVDVIPAQQRIGDEWYKGTADAIYQNSYAIEDINPQLILILAGDHIYKMNYQRMIDFHKEKNADVTVACVPMPKETSSHFGVIEVDDQGNVLGFQEKPQNPKTIPLDPNMISASMGIYLFKKDVLLDELEKDAKDPNSDRDFGKNVIPRMLEDGRKVVVHDFTNREGKPQYWRDIGTRDAYYQANMDLVRPNPEFNLFDRNWPVRTYHKQYPPVKVTSAGGNTGSIVDSLIGGGCMIEGATVTNSVLSSNVIVGKNAEVKNSVIMESVVIGENVKIQNAIIDKEVTVPPNTTIGYNLEEDREKFVLTTSGIAMVAKKASVVKD
ncbi:MAG: glucose-1-phosphate adenylyltransferase [Candidatus Omnitrophica bacterium]|nr:glucose-1-phosphate adenylyltransferase [Candidatus Omnitrophota bacterium]